MFTFTSIFQIEEYECVPEKSGTKIAEYQAILDDVEEIISQKKALVIFLFQYHGNGFIRKNY